MAANCANDWFRAPWRRREGPLEDALPAPEEPEPGGVVEAVLALPAKYRTAVHLYYYEELSVAEIAKIMGKSEGAVKSRLFRARAPAAGHAEGGRRCFRAIIGGRWTP